MKDGERSQEADEETYLGVIKQLMVGEYRRLTVIYNAAVTVKFLHGMF
jgi:hypothetical protein